MEITSKIDLKRVMDSLDKAINGELLSKVEKLDLYRFRDKLTVSEDFSKLVNKDFSGIVMKYSYEEVSKKLKAGKNVVLLNDFELRYKGGYWDLYRDGSLFLNNLDYKLAKKISRDINVAILIYNSRLNKI